MAIEKAMLSLFLLALFFNDAKSQTPAPNSYTNHTVGGAAGWFFNQTTKKSSADYSAWAAKLTFNLGDFLIFNTNTNQTVIQTYNETTYKSCSVDDATDDTYLFEGGSNEFGKAVTIEVPLTIEGTQYYFSGTDDGIPCQNGMAFEIKVGRGLGLPPSLNQPPPPAYVEPPSSGVESPPIAVIDNSPNSCVRCSISIFRVVSVIVALVSSYFV